MCSKCTKWGWFGVVRGHPRSSAMSSFDRAHTISYSSLIETMRLSCEGIRFATSVAPVRLPAWEPYCSCCCLVVVGFDFISLSEEINNFVSEIVLVSATVF